ncbi:MAG: MtnX-like HAD-IB family phosphatase [Melioribacteraceae bacterium]|nr:MtnX-like HAD-IB family phosphatase [Melioribacteraceae bacterium]
MKPPVKIKVFVDFDGTITTTDVGEAMFIKFGNEEKNRSIIKDWISKQIDSSAMWQQLCDTIDFFDEPAFNSFLDTIKLDEGFKSFVSFCTEFEIPIVVLSDGLDLYIKKIMSREGLSEIPVFCNTVEIAPDSKLIMGFPYTDEECKRCGNCKRNHIIDLSSDEDFTIYIGDGLTDTCPVQYCDYIFAKSSLLKFCEINRISYYPFNNFYEIKERIEELSLKKRLKKRHQAQLKRREIYIQG